MIALISDKQKKQVPRSLLFLYAKKELSSCDIYSHSSDSSLKIPDHYALSTKPERKQEVHTYIFLAPPLTLTLTDLTFAFQIALDLLWEWLTLLPK